MTYRIRIIDREPNDEAATGIALSEANAGRHGRKRGALPGFRPSRRDFLTFARELAATKCVLPMSATPRADIADGEYDGTPYISGPLEGIALGLRLAAKWHAERKRLTPCAFEDELHEVSATELQRMAALATAAQRAKTAKRVEGEAPQSGPPKEGNAQRRKP